MTCPFSSSSSSGDAAATLSSAVSPRKQQHSGKKRIDAPASLARRARRLMTE